MGFFQLCAVFVSIFYILETNAYSKSQFRFKDDDYKQLLEYIDPEEHKYELYISPCTPRVSDWDNGTDQWDNGGDQKDTRHNEEHMCPQQCLCKKTTVRCTGCNLTTLPGNISTDTAFLHIDHNIFTTLHNNTFMYLTALQGLWLGFNQLSEIGVKTFAYLHKLCYLDLSKNPLSMKVLEQSVFCALPMTSIAVLNITRLSSLVNFTENSMSCLRKTSLESIDVSYGRFGALCNMENRTFAGMKKLRIGSGFEVCTSAEQMQ